MDNTQRTLMGRKAHKVFSDYMAPRIGYRMPVLNDFPNGAPDAITPEGYPVELKPRPSATNSITLMTKSLNDEYQLMRYMIFMCAPEGEIWEWTYTQKYKRYDFLFRGSYTLEELTARRRKMLKNVIIARACAIRGIHEITIGV